MTLEDNKALVRHFFEEVFNQRNERSTAAILSPSFVVHHPAFPEGIRGVPGIMGMIGMFRAGFPDLSYAPDDLVAEGDKVAVRWTARGTHQGEFFGVPPTGRHVTAEVMEIHRIGPDGKIAEHWSASNDLGLLQQLGALPMGVGAVPGEAPRDPL